MSLPRMAALGLGLLAIVVIESGVRFPSPSADLDGAVLPARHAAHARDDERGSQPRTATLEPPSAPGIPVERLTVVDRLADESPSGVADAPTEMPAQGDGGRAPGTYQRASDRERMERRIRRCKYLAEISRVARRDVLVEIMYERHRLGCAALGY